MGLDLRPRSAGVRLASRHGLSFETWYSVMPGSTAESDTSKPGPQLEHASAHLQQRQDVAAMRAVSGGLYQPMAVSAFQLDDGCLSLKWAVPAGGSTWAVSAVFWLLQPVDAVCTCDRHEYEYLETTRI